MRNAFKLTFRLPIFLFFAACISTYFASATKDTSIKEPPQQISIVNAFAGCNIRLINFRGINIDFKVLKKPILLLRYLSHCKKWRLYPFELGSKYPALSLKNSSTCHQSQTNKANLPSDQSAKRYVQQTLSESFQMQSKNKICQANIYLHPPTEHSCPQMYKHTRYWESALGNPILVHYRSNYNTQKWKINYLNTVPMISLLICDSSVDSICERKYDVNKWVAGIFYEFHTLTLSVNVFIWEYPSLSLKTLCPYCDPCDSLKFIALHSIIVPTSKNELKHVLQENLRLNPGPHLVRVRLVADSYFVGDSQTRQAVLKFIQRYSIKSDMRRFFYSKDEHLISQLLLKPANITISENDKFPYRWKKVIIDACSPTKAINSYLMFRPILARTSSRSRILFQESRLVTSISQFDFVSCHKEQMHWANQLGELISPFDVATWSLILTICFIVSWIVNLSNNSQCTVGIPTLMNTSFAMFWCILDQPNSLITTTNKNPKPFFYCCMFFIPISWMCLSIFYKGENVTRLTAEPPLTKFDTFEMLEENQFTAYSRRYNLKTFAHAHGFNVSKLVKLHKIHGSVITHEAIPVVSELWYYLMLGLRWSNKLEFSLNFLRDEISKQMWKYINNSAMLPDYGQEYYESIATILNIHMNKCNKSAIILRSEEAIKLHLILKQMNKPSFFGKDKIHQAFWGYKFKGFFPHKQASRAGFLFDAGVIEWWQKFLEYSLVLKKNVHFHRLLPKTYNQTSTSEHGKSRTAVVILSLIPGVGLLISTFVFIFVENICRKAQRKKCMAFFRKYFAPATKVLHNDVVEEDDGVSIRQLPRPPPVPLQLSLHLVTSNLRKYNEVTMVRRTGAFPNTPSLKDTFTTRKSKRYMHNRKTKARKLSKKVSPLAQNNFEFREEEGIYRSESLADGVEQIPNTNWAGLQTTKNLGGNCSTHEICYSSTIEGSISGEGLKSSAHDKDNNANNGKYGDDVPTEIVWITYAEKGQREVSEKDFALFQKILEEEMEAKAQREQHLGWLNIEQTMRSHCGRIAVLCCNKETAKWVVAVTSRLFEGKFKAFELKNFPEIWKRKSYFAFIKGPLPTKDRLLTGLELHNPELEVKDWKVEDITAGIKGGYDGTWVNISIPNTSLDALEKKGFRPFFLSRRLDKLIPWVNKGLEPGGNE